MDEMCAALAKSALNSIERKLDKGFITNAHKIGTVLNPASRHLRGIPSFEKEGIYNLIRARIQPTTSQTQQERNLLSMEASDESTDELSNYMHSKFSGITESDFDLLNFWQTHKLQYPQMYVLALKYLSIPATSASAERSFSTLKRTITDQRTRLDPALVGKMIIGRSIGEFD